MAGVAPRTADVVIVGGGPAGSATAWMLARAGLAVVLLDRARFPREKPCAEYVSPQASRILAEMGVLERVEAAGAAQLAGMVVRAPSGAWFRGDFAADHGFRGFRDRGLALPRPTFDTVLLRAAEAAGARVVEGLQVTHLPRDGAGRVIGVNARTVAEEGVDGAEGAPAGRAVGGPSWTIRAAVVVGADGLRSVVARRLGVARSARWPRRLALVTRYRGVAGMGLAGEMHVDRSGYLGLADVGHGETNVALVVPARRAIGLGGVAGRGRAGFLDAWIAAHPHLAARFARAVRSGPVRATGPFAQRARRAWAPGAALVGDAADFYDPFTGEGIYAALRGGEMLAPYVHDAVRNLRPGAADRALAAYDRCRRHEFRGKWAVERLVAVAVSMPWLLDRVTRVLAARRDMADLFVGVAGDIVPAERVLRPAYLLRLLLPVRPGRARVPASAGTT